MVVAHPSADRYGSDRMVVESVAGLVEAGWDVVFTVPGEGSLVRDVQNAGAHVVQVPLPVLSKAQLGPRALPAFAAASLPAVVRAWRMLGRAAPAAVYVSTVTIPWWAVAGRLRGIPVVTHVHEAERSAHRALRMLLAAPLLLSRTVVANSRFALTTALEALPRLRDRSRIVPNGVVGPAEITATRPDLGEGVRMVYVGRLSPRKGVDVAVRATATLARRGVDARLDVVGAVFPGYEWYREELEALVVELDLGDRVVLHGFQEPMWPFLERADLALVPSRTDEPFGNTAVEAVLAGRPVVVTASGGLVEAVAGYRSARIVPPGDAEGLADGVQDLLADWSAARSQAVEDAAVAADRHAPGAYRARIAGAVAEVAR